MEKDIQYYNESVKILGGELSAVLLKIPDAKKQNIQEIRLRSGKPVALTEGMDTLFVCRDGAVIYSPGTRAVVCTRQNMSDCFKSICGYSIYSRQNEINSGFVTAKTGSRIGICGTANVKNGEISAVTDITSMNIRISRQIHGAAHEIITRLFPLRSGILIAGAPSTGKTTLLRDIAYNASLGNECRIMRTSVIDERGELSGGNKGELDLGLSDVQVGYPKDKGIIQAVRSLSPQVIICDEVGTAADADSVAQGANAGAFIIATIHAESYEALLKREQGRRLLKTGAFGTVVILGSGSSPGTVTEWIETGGV